MTPYSLGDCRSKKDVVDTKQEFVKEWPDMLNIGMSDGASFNLWTKKRYSVEAALLVVSQCKFLCADYERRLPCTLREWRWLCIPDWRIY